MFSLAANASSEGGKPGNTSHDLSHDFMQATTWKWHHFATPTQFLLGNVVLSPRPLSRYHVWLHTLVWLFHTLHTFLFSPDFPTVYKILKITSWTHSKSICSAYFCSFEGNSCDIPVSRKMCKKKTDFHFLWVSALFSYVLKLLWISFIRIIKVSDIMILLMCRRLKYDTTACRKVNTRVKLCAVAWSLYKQTLRKTSAQINNRFTHSVTL